MRKMTHCEGHVGEEHQDIEFYGEFEVVGIEEQPEEEQVAELMLGEIE